MPFWGLVATSAVFLAPAWIAKRKRAHRAAASFAIVTLTSLVYHTTVHPVARWVDMVIAHTMGSVYGWNILRASVQRPGVVQELSLGLGALAAYLYFGKSQRTTGMPSQWWHMGFHVTSQAAIGLHLCAL